jgi:plasmid maintenance system antidote protein VapI
MVLIHEKITALLGQRRLKKRDLARALGISPQTATDICKGRSAVTLPHLRNLIRFFAVGAEFWLDQDDLVPTELDGVGDRRRSRAMARSGLLQIDDPERFVHRLRTFLSHHRTVFLATHPDLSPAECAVLGLSTTAMRSGTVGQIGGD